MPPITKTQLQNAAIDAESLSDVINGPSGAMVVTRMGRQIKTLARVISELASTEIGNTVAAQINARISAMAPRRVATVTLDDWSSVEWPEGTDTILQRRIIQPSSWMAIWSAMAAPPATVDPNIHRESAGGRWWACVFDSRTANSNLMAAIAEMRDGRVYYAAIASPSGAVISPNMDFLILSNTGQPNITFWRPTSQPSDGLETTTIKRDGAMPARWWRNVSPDGETSGAVETGVLSSFLFSNIATISGFRNWNGSEARGNVADPLFSVSGLIPVNEGDCFRVILNSENTGVGSNIVAFYNSAAEPVGSLVNSSRRDAQGNDGAHVNCFPGDARNRIKYFRVPRNGFIRISSKTSVDVTSKLQKVTKTLYFKDHRYLGNAANLERLDVKSPIFASLNMIYNTNSAQVGVQWGGVSEQIPVMAGDYIQAYCASVQSETAVVFFDENGNYLSYSRAHNGMGGCFRFATNVGGLIAVENLKVSQNGFVALVTSSSNYPVDDANFIVVTKNKFNYSRNYSQAGNNHKLSRYANVMLGAADDGVMLRDYVGLDVIGPVFAKKGEIIRVEARLPANVASMSKGWLFSDNAVSTNLYKVRLPDSQLYATTVPSVAHTQIQWLSSGDGDFAAMAHSLSGTGDIRVVSYSEFAAERNSLIAAQIPVQGRSANVNFMPAGNNSAALMATGFIPVFPGEVARVKTSAQSLIQSLTVDAKIDQDTRIGQFADKSILMPGIIVGGDNNAALAAQCRFVGVSRFGWIGVDSHSSTPADFFGDKPNVVISHDDYLSYRSVDAAAIAQAKVTNCTFDTSGNLISITAPGDVNHSTFRPFFVKKGQCVKIKNSTDIVQTRYNPLVIYVNSAGQISAKAMYPVFPAAASNHMQTQSVTGYFKAPYDCYILFSSRLGNSVNPANNTDAYRINYFAQMEAEFISENEYLRNTELFKGTLLEISDLRGISIDHINGVMAFDRSGDRVRSDVIIQIKKGGEIIANLLNREEVQGKGSALPNIKKPNLDIKARNASGQRVSFKIEDWKETQKLTLKSYATELTHIRDTAAAEIWRQIRKARPYPDNCIFDPRAKAQDPSWPIASFMQDAVCSTRGVPIRVNAGGKFNGIYTLREKKDAPNYAIDLKNPNNIWLQNDYQAYSLMVTWSQPMDWRCWDVTSPEIDGYEVGDDITATNPLQAQACERFFQWVVDCIAGTVDFSTTYADYIYLDPWLDYLIAGELVKHDDGARNNIVLTTNDAIRWSVHAYDLDWSMGAEINNADRVSTSGFLFDENNTGIWRLLYTHMRPNIEARWAELRKNAISRNNILEIISRTASFVSDSSRAEDVKLWGDKPIRSGTYISDWMMARITWIDAQYNYSE